MFEPHPSNALTNSSFSFGSVTLLIEAQPLNAFFFISVILPEIIIDSKDEHLLKEYIPICFSLFGNLILDNPLQP